MPRLCATVQAEQQARDTDTQHWLSRLAEHQAAVAEARAREAVLIQEKKALALEAQRLRQDLRKVPGAEPDWGDSMAVGNPFSLLTSVAPQRGP